jgi:hypothetical protein
VATSSLRPLSVGEILDAGIKVVTRHWKPLIGAQMLISAPIFIVFVLLLASIDSTSFELVPDDTASSSDPSAAVLVGFFLSILLLLLAFVASFTALFKGVCDAWLGIEPELGRSFKYGLRHGPMVLLLTIIWYIPVILFSCALCVPGLWLITVWSLSIPALLFERKGPFKALGRSYRLIHGRFWQSLLLVLVCVVFTYVVGFAIQLPVLAVVAALTHDNGVANAIAQTVGTILSSAVTYPYMAAVLTILYFDQRVRKEGFDIQLLAQGLGVERDPDAPLPEPLVPSGQPYQYQPQPQGWNPTPSSGWAPPQAERDEPPLWGPKPAPDARPESESPWMTPRPEPKLPPVDLDKKRKDDDWPPRESPRGPSGL